MTARAAQRGAITDLLGSYCTAYDSGAAESLSALFTDDARFHGLGIDVRGATAITAQLVPDGRPGGRRTHHVVGDPEIAFDDDGHARATTRFAVVIVADGGALFGAGVYTDSVVRSGAGDGWRFADRAVALDVPLTAMNVDNTGGTQ